MAHQHQLLGRGARHPRLPAHLSKKPEAHIVNLSSIFGIIAPPGQTAPVWNDVCANANDGRCVVTGRLSRLRADGNTMTGSEQVLLHDWCQQFPSHSIGDIAFGVDGMLYVAGGDERQLAVRILGPTGRVRVFAFDRAAARWVPR